MASLASPYSRQLCVRERCVSVVVRDAGRVSGERDTGRRLERPALTARRPGADGGGVGPRARLCRQREATKSKHGSGAGVSASECRRMGARRWTEQSRCIKWTAGLVKLSIECSVLENCTATLYRCVGPDEIAYLTYCPVVIYSGRARVHAPVIHVAAFVAHITQYMPLETAWRIRASPRQHIPVPHTLLTLE